MVSNPISFVLQTNTRHKPKRRKFRLARGLDRLSNTSSPLFSSCVCVCRPRAGDRNERPSSGAWVGGRAGRIRPASRRAKRAVRRGKVLKVFTIKLCSLALSDNHRSQQSANLPFHGRGHERFGSERGPARGGARRMASAVQSSARARSAPQAMLPLLRPPRQASPRLNALRSSQRYLAALPRRASPHRGSPHVAQPPHLDA